MTVELDDKRLRKAIIKLLRPRLYPNDTNPSAQDILITTLSNTYLRIFWEFFNDICKDEVKALMEEANGYYQKKMFHNRFTNMKLNHYLTMNEPIDLSDPKQLQALYHLYESHVYFDLQTISQFGYLPEIMKNYNL